MGVQTARARERRLPAEQRPYATVREIAVVSGGGKPRDSTCTGGRRDGSRSGWLVDSQHWICPGPVVRRGYLFFFFFFRFFSYKQQYSKIKFTETFKIFTRIG